MDGKWQTIPLLIFCGMMKLKISLFCRINDLKNVILSNQLNLQYLVSLDVFGSFFLKFYLCNNIVRITDFLLQYFIGV